MVGEILETLQNVKVMVNVSGFASAVTVGMTPTERTPSFPVTAGTHGLYH